MKKYLNSEGKEIQVGTLIVCKVLNTETGRRTTELVIATEEVL